MNRTNPTLPLVSLVIANLIPLAGVLWWGWDVGEIVLLYWAENLIIGFYHILKMGVAPMPHPMAHLGKLFIIPFFILHYGGFCGGHGIFVYAIFEGGFMNNTPGANAGMDNIFPDGDAFGPLIFVHLLVNVVATIWQTLPPGMIWPLVGLFLGHGIEFVTVTLLQGQLENKNLNALMGEPYGRILVLHVAIILGGMGTMALGSPLALLVVFVVLKLIGEIVWFRRAHRSRTGSQRPLSSP